MKHLRPLRPTPCRVRATLAAAAGLATLLALSGGCAKAKAAGVPDGPPLAVPAPPERVLAPVEEAQPLASTATTPDVEAPQAPPRPGPARPQRRPPAASEETTDAPGATASAPATAPPAPVDPPRELRTTQSGADPRQVQQLIDRAERDLRDVDYGKLTREGQENYRLAQRYGREAKDALKDRNFLSAEAAAKKASSLAAALLGSR